MISSVEVKGGGGCREEGVENEKDLHTAGACGREGEKEREGERRREKERKRGCGVYFGEEV